MKYVHLGESGLAVSRAALGSWLTFGETVDLDGTRACVRAALDAGVNFFDTADIYGGGEAERALGAALEGIPRPTLVLATKAFFPMSDDPNDRGLSRKHLFESIDASLSRLRTDYVDLYQCHRFDADTPLGETVRAMGDLIRRGKVLYWGVSCWRPSQIKEVCFLADEMDVPPPISNQPPYSLLDRQIEQEVMPVCDEEGLSQVVFSPLAQGILTGKYKGGRKPAGSRGADGERNHFMQEWLGERGLLGRVDKMAGIAADIGTTPARLALAWCLRDERVASVIFGARTPEQMADNAAAVDLEIDDDVLDALDDLFPGPGEIEEI